MGKHSFLPLLILCTMGWIPLHSHACSMGKITLNGTTWLGSNEDNWRTGARMQFRQGEPGEYGAVFFVFDDFYPQGGMNTEGLAYDGLTVPRQHPHPDKSLGSFGSASEFLRYALHHFASVDEVHAYMTGNRMSLSTRGMFVFSDRYGRILIAEPDTLILCDDSQFIIANYCPSNTEVDGRMKFERYRRGSEFLAAPFNLADSLMCTALMATMHVNRPEHQDGTLYTFVADLNRAQLKLAFYHNYDEWKTIDLRTELARGNHTIEISSLFSPNPNYLHLQEYQTSFNNNPIRFYLVFLALLSAVFLTLTGWFALRRKKIDPVQAFSAIMSAGMIANAFFFVTDHSLFFMAPAPFSAPDSKGFIPVWIAILSIVIAMAMVYHVYSRAPYSSPERRQLWIPAIQWLSSLPLLVLFFYWKIPF